MSMNRNEIAESLWDNSIRIDKIIWLAANSSHLSSDLRDFLEYEDVQKILGVPPPDEDAGRFLDEYIGDISRKGKNGYLVQAATPVRTDLGKGMSSYSWGECYLGWFYFETWDEAAVTTALVGWKDSMDKKPRRRAKKRS